MEEEEVELPPAPLYELWLGLAGLLVGALDGLVWPDLLGAPLEVADEPTFVEWLFNFETESLFAKLLVELGAGLNYELEPTWFETILIGPFLKEFIMFLDGGFADERPSLRDWVLTSIGLPVPTFLFMMVDWLDLIIKLDELWLWGT